MKKKVVNNFINENKIKIIISLLFIILLILFFIYISIPYNCKYDEDCFNERFENCKKTDFYKIINGDTYQFECKGKYKNSCLLNIKMIMANDASDFFVKENMVGRGMICKLPKGDFQTLNQINNSLDYCTGPLKESMLEQMIKNMFELIVKDIGPITKDMQKQFENKTII